LGNPQSVVSSYTSSEGEAWRWTDGDRLYEVNFTPSGNVDLTLSFDCANKLYDHLCRELSEEEP
jgi:hypothetical protein